jgi:chemotaxis protein MotA
MDATTFIGVAFALGCVLFGQVLEGGRIDSVLQLAAALIVVGGTLGAIIAQFPLEDLLNALRQLPQIFTSRRTDLTELARSLVELSRKSRREGLLVLEEEASRTKDPFLRTALSGLVDGNDLAHLRALLDASLDHSESVQESGPRLLEAAGGYAPTLGILGAVLGLIHVMENLSDPSKLGDGIAVAFVATVYGVGSANLLFLPLAQKLRMKIAREQRRKEMIVEGACCIQEGLNPQMLERRLQAFANLPDLTRGRTPPSRPERPLAPRPARKTG